MLLFLYLQLYELYALHIHRILYTKYGFTLHREA